MRSILVSQIRLNSFAVCVLEFYTKQMRSILVSQTILRPLVRQLRAPKYDPTSISSITFSQLRKVCDIALCALRYLLKLTFVCRVYP